MEVNEEKIDDMVLALNTKPNTIVRFDPKTEKFQTWAIPSGGGVVRNIVHTLDLNLTDATQALQAIHNLPSEASREFRRRTDPV